MNRLKNRCLPFVFVLPWTVAAQIPARPPNVLPPPATDALARSLKGASAHARHVWRDTPPMNGDGTINAYVEIARGDRRKWEFDMRANARAIDRVIPAAIGGYPVNYGFVPQTVSYDGDPFDALILGDGTRTTSLGAFPGCRGWESAAAGLAYVTMTHTFFRECRERAGASCAVGQ